MHTWVTGNFRRALETLQNNNYMLHALVARLYPQSRTSGITNSVDEVAQVLQTLIPAANGHKAIVFWARPERDRPHS